MIRYPVLWLMALISLPSMVVCGILGTVFGIEYKIKINIPGK